MKTTVKLIRKSKRFNICPVIEEGESNNEQRRLKQLPLQSLQLNSNFENQGYDNYSSNLSSLDNNLIGDITENLDSVYSHKLMNKNHLQITKTTDDSKNKLIRYTVKREKDSKRKKQKNRGKSFSLEEDQRLLNYILKKGPKFHKFSRYFPGKTTNMLKNRYYKSLRYEQDQVLGNQFKTINQQSKEQVPIMAQESSILMFNELIQLQLYPEVEDLLSNFIGNLSQTFHDIHTSSPLENY